MSVLVGISATNDILTSLAEADQEIPIFNTMQNTGISLALSIYLFSIVNCLVVTNYWIITKRRDMAIRKAFGWSNYNLICAVVSEMAEILLVSLCIGFLLIEVFSRMTEGIISIHITPFFLCGTLLLLLFTLVISVIIPVIRILKIHPAEAIS
ncbi:FtsX-like permease family protein [Anaerotignum lactatifermentans]|nr:FtsX-like permease family protein [Anaerotignum lactatifermentans]